MSDEIKNETTAVELPPAAKTMEFAPSMAELMQRIDALSSAFGEERAARKSVERELASIRSTNESLASGNVPTLFMHCNNCGEVVTEDDDGNVRCKAHPRAMVNHVGNNPAPHQGGGKYVLVKQHPGIAANAA